MPEKKLSIIVPVYYNAENLLPLYDEIKESVIDKIDADVEILFVDDGSGDGSWEVLKSLKAQHQEVKIIHLSRNFGSHAAILCGLSFATGDCAVVKAADSQEPCEIILKMFAAWKEGNNVVLAVRDERDDPAGTTFFSNFYYWFIAKVALPTMPPKGFDVYLIDRKVIEVLKLMDEKNSALTGQILWSGFKTETVYYKRLARTSGRSRWTMKKKIRLFLDSVFSFTSLPITLVAMFGVLATIGSIVWAIIVIITRLSGGIVVEGWTSSFIFNLFSFGITMLVLGLLGGYLWRAFDASRNRPLYIVEEVVGDVKREKDSGDLLR
jgi:dolichol-phosphate mannosyltransferase